MLAAPTTERVSRQFKTPLDPHPPIIRDECVWRQAQGGLKHDDTSMY